MTDINPHHIHQEWALQEHFISSLVKHEGYLRRAGSERSKDYVGEVHFDKAHAMDRELVVRFIESTQPVAWQKLNQQYKTNAEDTLFRQLDRALKNQGLLEVLRKGIKIVPNIAIRMCYFRPASSLEPKRVEEYESNLLSVMDEVEYSQKSGNRIDIVLFVNGLPVVTIEAKNLLTGTKFRDAERQYRQDRPPPGEPLLTFKRGALVHFALDEDNVSMTTRLQNSRTRFLPFNRGRNGGAGNPDIPGDHRIAFLYKPGEWGDAIFSRSILLDVLGRFAHLESQEGKRTMIFPRFHQLDCVRRCLKHANTHGPGNNYLIQHSAGSGKSNTIGWLAHQAINLHDTKDLPIFNTAIIVTNRVVLDRQLQNTVGQFEQTPGIVKRIDGTSRQLKEAILSNARIIVTTIQKFSTDHLLQISGQSKRTFAVIVDEAHSGQSGKGAQAMVDALRREANSSEDIEDMIAAIQKSRGPQPNISFFAFTATPRNVTLERFGVIDADGLPNPFHLYSMRQAIEEKFILDVLQHYTTYKTYYKLEKAIEEDPALRPRPGYRKVARYATLHPTSVAQRVETIVEHFRTHVAHEIGGQAKGMIVTESREHAFRYYQGMKHYIENNEQANIGVLVAFSGELSVDGTTVTEQQLNGFSETELPSRFDGMKQNGETYPETYSILIVAEKYQTGFDQPKLCAMYVDRDLSGLQAVQTLSRLNRTSKGKTHTFVLDFKNEIEDIRDAFKPYYESTELSDTSDPNQIYELAASLYNSGYLSSDEINEYAMLYFKLPLNVADRPRLAEIVRKGAVQRFSEDDDEDRQEEFRQTLKSFNRFYTFISQVVYLEDTDLEKLHVYGEMLSRMLPNREVPPDIELTDDMLDLQAIRMERKHEGSATPEAGDAERLNPIRAFGANPYTDEEKQELSEIVKTFNERHGTEFTEDDMIRFEQVNEKMLQGDMKEKLRNNPPDVAYNAYNEEFTKNLIQLLRKEQDLQVLILQDEEARERVTRHFFNRALRQIDSSQ